MKNLLLSFVITIACSSPVFPNTTDIPEDRNKTMMGLGFAYGFQFNRHTNNGTVTTSMQSPGMSIHIVLFRNEDQIAGFYVNYFSGFPQSFRTENEGAAATVNLEYGAQTSIIAGAGFRFYITDKLVFLPAVGLHVGSSEYEYIRYVPALDAAVLSKTRGSSFGIGADIGMAFKLSGLLGLHMGSMCLFDFMGRPPSHPPGFAKDYFQFTARPYISIALVVI